MPTRKDIVEELASLSAADRAWILGRLSPSVREKLLNEPSAAESTAVAAIGGNGKNSNGLSEALNGANSAAVVAVIANEPAWLVAAVLSRPWSWRDRVRAGLPVQLTAEVAALERSGITFGKRMLEFVERTVADALGQAASSETVSSMNRSSKFDSLVASFGSKLSNRRTRGRL